MEKNIKVIVATHKKYQMPNDDMYIPVHVGKEGKNDIGFIGDNTGNNISIKNPYFCELTGVYWAWKNLDCDILVFHIIEDISPLEKNQKTNWIMF